LDTEKYIVSQQYKPLITALANRSITKNLVPNFNSNFNPNFNLGSDFRDRNKDESKQGQEDDVDIEYQRQLINDVVKGVKIDTVVYSEDEDVHTIDKLHARDYVTIAVTNTDANKHCIINAPRWNASDDKHENEIATYIAAVLKPKFTSEVGNYTVDLKQHKLLNPNFNSDFWCINKYLVKSLEYFNCSLHDHDRVCKMLWVTDPSYRELPRVRNQVDMMQMGVRIQLNK